MNGYTGRIASFLLYLIALAWPLEVFQYVPVLNVSVVGLTAGVLCLLLVLDLRLQGNLRIPFEILWPVAAVLVITAVSLFRDDTRISMEVVLALFLFVATAHFASSRGLVERCLLAGAAVGGAAAALTIYSWASGRAPTAYSLDSGATLNFAYDVPGGIHIVLVSLIVAAFIGTRPGGAWLTRLAGLLLVIILTTCLVGLVSQTYSEAATWIRPAYRGLSILAVAALMGALWIVARVSAKIEIDRRESDAGHQTMFLTIVVVSVLFVSIHPLAPRLYHAYLLGLGLAYVLPDRSADIVFPKWNYAACLVFALVPLNLLHIFPRHQADPRNYVVVAARDLETGDVRLALKRMDFVDTYYPHESRTHFVRAQGAIVVGDHEGASDEFVHTLNVARIDAAMFQPPTLDEMDDFLVRLRDLCSSLERPETAFAYERARAAYGDREAALYLLKLRVGTPLFEDQAMDTRPLARTVALLLGDETVAEDLQNWPSSQLLTLLSYWGAKIESSRPGVPEDLLPWVILAQPSSRGPYVVVSTSTHTADLILNAEASPELDLDASKTGDAEWTSLTEESHHIWFTELVASTVDGEASLARVTFEFGKAPRIEAGDTQPRLCRPGTMVVLP